MGRYGPYLECGNVTRPAIPHVSSSSPPSLLETPDLLQQSVPQRGIQSQDLSPSDAVVSTETPEESLTSVEGVISLSPLGGGNSSSDSVDPTSTSSAEGEERPWYSMVSLDRAVGLLSLPRVVCDSHPTEGGPIEVGIGRYGAYVKHRELYKVVPKRVDVLDVDEALAVELVDQMIQVGTGLGYPGGEGEGEGVYAV